MFPPKVKITDHLDTSESLMAECVPIVISCLLSRAPLMWVATPLRLEVASEVYKSIYISDYATDAKQWTFAGTIFAVAIA